MTVKEETLVTSTHTFKLAKISPMMTHGYSEYLISDKHNMHMLEAWDLMMGVNNLASCIATLQKALDKKNGIPEPDPTADKYYIEVD